MRLVISLALIVAAVYFVASGDQAQHTLGASLLGAVTGYWLK